MQYRALGGSDRKVSAVAMGCWSIVGDETWGGQDEAESLQAISAALDAGINFFDTAELYGHGYSERMLGKVLADVRKDVVIASKPAPKRMSPEEIAAACDESLKRLKTDYIDLYQLHWPSRDVPFADSVAAMLDLKKQGKICQFAVCNFGPSDLDKLLAIEKPVTNQLAYNMLFRAAEFEIQPKCVENDIGILCYSPIAQGLLTGKFTSPDGVPHGRARTRHFRSDRVGTRHGEGGCEGETFQAINDIGKISEGLGIPMAELALAWLLHQPGVTSVLAGGRKPSQMTENAKAADIKLSAETLEQLDQATEKVKSILGPSLDMWQHEPRLG